MYNTQRLVTYHDPSEDQIIAGLDLQKGLVCKQVFHFNRDVRGVVRHIDRHRSIIDGHCMWTTHDHSLGQITLGGVTFKLLTQHYAFNHRCNHSYMCLHHKYDWPRLAPNHTPTLDTLVTKLRMIDTIFNPDHHDLNIGDVKTRLQGLGIGDELFSSLRS
jgi:hypothetical protein